MDNSYVIGSIGGIYDNNQREATLYGNGTKKEIKGIISIDSAGNLHFSSDKTPPAGTNTYVSCEDKEFADLTIGDILTF